MATRGGPGGAGGRGLSAGGLVRRRVGAKRVRAGAVRDTARDGVGAGVGPAGGRVFQYSATASARDRSAKKTVAGETRRLLRLNESVF